MIDGDIVDIDFKILVKFENEFFVGNIYVDNNYISYFKFGSKFLNYNLKPDPALYSRYDLIDRFESHPSFTSEILLFEIDDVCLLGKEIIDRITSKSVRAYCELILRRIDEAATHATKVVILNELLLQSKISEKDLPKSFLTNWKISFFTRKIHQLTNQYGKIFFRVAFPKKIIKLEVNRLDIEQSDIFFQIQLNSNSDRLLFSGIDKIDQFPLEKPIIITGALIDNKDGSKRFNIPDIVLEALKKDKSSPNIFIKYTDGRVSFSIFNFAS